MMINEDSGEKKQRTGFFTMKDAAEVLKFKSLDDAKVHLVDKVKAFKDSFPNTKQENLIKAGRMIDRANSIERLSIAVSNFVLAHTSENLAVIK